MDTTAVDTAISAFFTSVQDNIISVLLVVLPIAATILGVFLAVRYGKQFFKTVSKG